MRTKRALGQTDAHAVPDRSAVRPEPYIVDCIRLRTASAAGIWIPPAESQYGPFVTLGRETERCSATRCHNDAGYFSAQRHGYRTVVEVPCRSTDRSDRPMTGQAVRIRQSDNPFNGRLFDITLNERANPAEVIMFRGPRRSATKVKAGRVQRKNRSGRTPNYETADMPSLVIGGGLRPKSRRGDHRAVSTPFPLIRTRANRPDIG